MEEAKLPPDWIHEGLPYYGQNAQVWLANGEVRSVRRGWEGLFFLDCRHPLSNMWCDPQKIMAWRFQPKS